MNIDFFHVNNNKYAVSDDDGDIKIIKADGNKDLVFDVLSYENDLEIISSKFGMNEDMIINLENNEYVRKFSNVLLIIAGCVFVPLFAFISSTLGLILSILPLLAIKCIMLVIYGTSKINNYKLSLARNNRYEFLCKIDHLKNTIKEMKENANFKVIDDEDIVDNITDNYCDFVLENGIEEIYDYQSDYGHNSKYKIRRRTFGTK